MAKGVAKKITVRTHKDRIKFDSVAAAAVAAGVPYMTFYMRVHKLGMSPSEASKKPVRAYRRKAVVVPVETVDFVPLGA